MIDRDLRQASRNRPRPLVLRGARFITCRVRRRGRSRTHAPDRQAASGVPLRGQCCAAFCCHAPPRHIKTLMRRMGIEALYRRPRTTKPEPGHKVTPICCGAWRSGGRTRSGRWTSRISPWRKALFISPPCSTGSRGACCRGGCPSRWRPRSASRRWRTLWPAMEDQRSSTPIRAASSRDRLHRRAHQERHRD